MAAHLKSHRTVARLNETGAFRHDAKLMGCNDNDLRWSHGSWRGVLILTTGEVELLSLVAFGISVFGLGFVLISTLPTSGEGRNSARTVSAKSRASRGGKP